MLIEKRLTLPELSQRTGIPYPTVLRLSKKEDIKISSIRKMEEDLGDLSSFIISEPEPEAAA
jgi:predicted transcriptional regulator